MISKLYKCTYGYLYMHVCGALVQFGYYQHRQVRVCVPILVKLRTIMYMQWASELYWVTNFIQLSLA